MEFINRKEIEPLRCKFGTRHKPLELKTVDGYDLYYQCLDCGLVVKVNIDY
jgi:hypothetical protein